MKEQIGYKCDYCSRMSSSKGAMTNHETHCRKNPNNKPMCDNCNWLWFGFKNQERTRVLVEDRYHEEAMYEIEPRSCPFLGKMYHKFNCDLAAKLEAQGFVKQPTESKGCEYFISNELADEVRKWYNRKRFINLGNMLLERVTPDIIADYYDSQEMHEDAEKWRKFKKRFDKKLNSTE